MNKFLLTSLFIIAFVSASFSQAISDFKKGEKLPSLFLNNSETTFHSCSFTKLHKLVYVHFWDVNSDTSKSNLGTVSKLYDKYVKYNYKNDVKFDVITIAVGKNIENWKKYLSYYNLSKELNYISFDSYCDLYIKNVKISKTPYSLLIDETGSIVLCNPSNKEVGDYLNKISAENPDNTISGKIMIGSKSLVPLAYRKIYIVNKKNDTIQTLITSATGNFTIKNQYSKNEIFIKISKYPEILKPDKVFLSSQKGKIIGLFIGDSLCFTYEVLSKNIFQLKPIEEEDPGMVTLELKNKMFYVEHLFHSNETIITDSAQITMDKIILKLKENSNFKIEIKSFTDITGNPALNLKLSNTRAKHILDYFISKGIDKKRIVSIGIGDKSPIIKCDSGNCSPAEIELNRRTEFKISKITAPK